MHTKLLATLLICMLSQVPAFGADPGDEKEIRHLLSSTFDRPDAKVVADPVAVSGEYAIAGWRQAEKGGRALLRREKGHWVITACAGKDFKGAANLALAGIPMEDARSIAQQQKAAEDQLPDARRKLFDAFGPKVGIETHSPHHGDQH